MTKPLFENRKIEVGNYLFEVDNNGNLSIEHIRVRRDGEVAKTGVAFFDIKETIIVTSFLYNCIVNDPRTVSGFSHIPRELNYLDKITDNITLIKKVTEEKEK